MALQLDTRLRKIVDKQPFPRFSDDEFTRATDQIESILEGSADRATVPALA